MIQAFRKMRTAMRLETEKGFVRHRPLPEWTKGGKKIRNAVASRLALIPLFLKPAEKMQSDKDACFRARKELFSKNETVKHPKSHYPGRLQSRGC